ncbi:Brp/Blh family beta-carotene 15,15'-dioxygenase [Hymenobacter sp. DG25A]|uniref:Brp/Blh family beta-carotene 15,15'-dioxygenase n=1 Tax=Hymenobacter sp. DG25A TaxID=1385663 RepID=UPI000A6AB450|nr:Brp/Blh family beta-carotene 15,15'-dioxygenase [Hymenobacter sp. DG25A]
MPSSSTLFATTWDHRRYSYAAVLAATGVGLAFPNQAALLLALPLAVGMVVLGIAHGACDQLVVPARQPAGRAAAGWHYWLRFLLSYLGLAAVVGLLWWRWPATTVGVFFGLTIWHWGSADAPSSEQVPAGWWLLHSLLRGVLLFAVPAWWWPTETAAIVNGLLAFAGAAAVAPLRFGQAAAALGLLALGGHLVLWGRYASRRRWGLLRTELVEVPVLVALLLILPPKLSVSVYFIFWHSLQHVLRLNGWLGYPRAAGVSTPPRLRFNLMAQLAFFLRRAAPLLAISCGALLVLGHVLADRLSGETTWFSLALIVASIVTLPHALLVTLVMDAHHWQRPRSA